MDQQPTKKDLSIPASIVIAGLLIAGAVFLSTTAPAPSSNQEPSAEPQGSTTEKELAKMRPVESKDHIRGNRDAKVVVVEYSDFECPFCKGFHETMRQAVDEYGPSGKLAWIYRHFPIDSLHPVKARKEAAATECAAELGGNDAFWKFADRFFELTPSNNRTDIETVLPQIAREIGLDEKRFTECLASGRYDVHIEADLQNAMETGGNGTPWSIIVAPNGKRFPLYGAQNYATVKRLIELALKEV